MELTPGKLWGLRRLADANGRFKMTAVDQRPPIMKLIERRRGVAEATYDDVAAVKTLLTRVLAPESSAMLLDPVWAYPRAHGHLLPGRGLLVTLEDHAYRETPGGRLSAAIADWSVAKIRRMGADAVKLLAWYRPDAAPEVIEHQRRFVETVGRACAVHDICFVLELLVYPLRPSGGGPDYAEDPGKRPELVVESVRAFADPAYGVDLWKLESPVPAASVPDPDGPGSAGCQEWFDRLGAATTRPWVVLSAGADMAAFERIATHAYRAGASGYLAGRAIWAEAFQQFPDMAAVEDALADEAVAYMRRLNALTDRLAPPWRSHPCFADGLRLAGETAGPDFPRHYAAPNGD